MDRNLFPIPIVKSAEDLESVAAAIRADHEAVKQAGIANAEKARDAGEKLALVKDKLKGEHGWIKWLKNKVGISPRMAQRYLKVYQEWDKCDMVSHLGLSGCLEFLRTGKTGDEEEDEEEDNDEMKYVTLDQWNEAGEKVRKRLLATKGDDKFNDQGDSESIEWAMWSWNPVTGCLHNCPYCYARDIAERFYDQKFAPSLWPNRLKAPHNTTFPEAKAAEWMGHKNVFVCSMADLFGRWVPKEWIDAVLAECRAAAQWNFLFLTKFPVRMAEFDFSDNCWVGTTVDCQARVANAERSFRKVKAAVKWLSCEPLIEPVVFKDIAAFDWIVLGGASRSRETPEWYPPRDWITAIEAAAVKAGVHVYEKANLLRRIRQYPGVNPNEPTQAPAELRYLPMVETKEAT